MVGLRGGRGRLFDVFSIRISTSGLLRRFQGLSSGKEVDLSPAQVPPDPAPLAAHTKNPPTTSVRGTVKKTSGD